MKELLANRICLFVVILGMAIFPITLYSQQIPQFTQYQHHELLLNPAAINPNYGIHIDGIARLQWLGIEGQPFTQGVNVHTTFPVVRSGVGLTVLNDMLGAERNTSIYVNYAYIQPLPNKQVITLGIRGGMIQKALDGSKLIAPDGTYTGGVFSHGDDLLPTDAASALVPDVGIGLFFRSKRFKVGVASQQLLTPKAVWTIGNQVSEITYTRHLSLQSSYTFSFGDAWEVMPSVLAKSDLKKHQIDISTLLTYNSYWQLGASWRGVGNKNFEAIAVVVGFPVSKQLHIGYAYDIITNSLQQASTGTHELSFRYTLANIGKPKPTKTIHSPRFL